MPRIEPARALLDPQEETICIDSGRRGLRLFLRRLASAAPVRGPVLHLHGATFPSALSIAYRLGGRSWRDALCNAGFDVWTLDFLGFGGSDRYPEMDEPAEAHEPPGVAPEALHQVETAARFILEQERALRLSIITHCWGSMPAGLFAARHPTVVDRIVMFAPITRREGPRYAPRPALPAWKLVTNEEQWAHLVEECRPPNRPCFRAKTSTAGQRPISTAIPALGVAIRPVISRMAVPAASTAPISEGPRPRS